MVLSHSRVVIPKEKNVFVLGDGKKGFENESINVLLDFSVCIKLWSIGTVDCGMVYPAVVCKVSQMLVEIGLRFETRTDLFANPAPWMPFPSGGFPFQKKVNLVPNLVHCPWGRKCPNLFLSFITSPVLSSEHSGCWLSIKVRKIHVDKVSGHQEVWKGCEFLATEGWTLQMWWPARAEEKMLVEVHHITKKDFWGPQKERFWCSSDQSSQTEGNQDETCKVSKERNSG